MKKDALRPSHVLLGKLGTILVHIEEALSPRGHPLNVLTIKELMRDRDVEGWLAEMHRLVLVQSLTRGTGR